MRNGSLLFLSAGFLASLSAQPDNRAALNLASGFLTAQKSVAYGIAGEFETYNAPALGLIFRGRVSLRGDAYGFMAQNPAARLRQNYQLHLGVIFNIGERRGLMPFVGFQPGFGATQVDTGGTAVYFYPSLSPLFGAHYFFDGRLHASFTLRYVFGELGARDTGAVYLSEGRMALGVGTQW